MTVNNRARERRPRIGAIDAALDHATWRALSAVVCPSQSTAERLRDARGVPAGIVHVIHYGIAAPVPIASDVARLRRELAPHGELLVGMVVAPDPSGEHARHKGHGVLLEALARCGRADVRAVFVGHDPGPSFADRAVELGLSERITLLTGFRDAAPYTAAFDLLAVPSTGDEALPLVIIEAMASHTPVVGSRLAGIPEAVLNGETGYTVPPGDVPALAAVIGSCAMDRAPLTRLAQRTYKRYEREFSLDTMVTRTVAVYDLVVAEHPSHRRSVRRHAARRELGQAPD